jgi:hypothetical protein
MALEEMDVFPFQTLAEGIFAEVWNAVIDAFAAVNVATTLGRKLPDLFDRAGLEAVEPVCEMPVFRGDTDFTAMLMASIALLRPLVIGGVTEEQLAELDRVFSDPTRWFSGFAVYSVRGRAPAA